MGCLTAPQYLPAPPARLVSVSVAREGSGSLCKDLILWGHLKIWSEARIHQTRYLF